MLYDLPAKHLARYWISYSMNMSLNNACTRPKLQGRTGECETIWEHTSVQLLALSFPKNGSSVFTHCYRHTQADMFSPAYEDRTRYGEIHNRATREGGTLLCVGEFFSHVDEFPASALLYWGQLPWACHSCPSHHFNWRSPSVHFWSSMGKMGHQLTYFNRAETQVQSLKYI